MDELVEKAGSPGLQPGSLWSKPKYDIDTEVIITKGVDKGIKGLYKGIQNNTDWHVVQDGPSTYYLNYEEFEKVKKKNIKRFQKRFKDLCIKCQNRLIDYDELFNFIEGWCAYARNANTYKLKKNALKRFESLFPGEISTKEIPKCHKNHLFFTTSQKRILVHSKT